MLIIKDGGSSSTAGLGFMRLVYGDLHQLMEDLDHPMGFMASSITHPKFVIEWERLVLGYVTLSH